MMFKVTAPKTSKEACGLFLLKFASHKINFKVETDAPTTTVFYLQSRAKRANQMQLQQQFGVTPSPMLYDLHHHQIFYEEY
ncbi:hypothetical protein FRX31_022913 [Thalictrum thalictroides]|uniref:Uncharacterized protein n=1 Tax=Thalictrum thalictroides TaxID=46969 RepID=A0A7J6VTJ5_THATH|nr:hypothetical protein FRX31_022913 [Thalictrum thalictroides]